MDNGEQFFAAIRAGDTATARAMLEADPALATARNEQGQSPMLTAVYGGRAEIRDLLLAQGVHLEFYEAVAAGQLESLEQSVEKDPELVRGYSPDGFPVLALAAAFGHFPIVRYLFEKGGDVTAVATNGSGYNAITGAVTNGHQQIVTWLLENGADANYRYGPGYTPLHAAAANGHLAIVKELLVHGADINAKSNDGKSALTIAEERKHPEIAEYLRFQGAA